MDLVLFLAVGLVAGVAVQRMIPWRPANRLWVPMGAGILGAFAGAFVGHLLGHRGTEPPVFVTSALGALAMVVLYQVVTAGRTSR